MTNFSFEFGFWNGTHTLVIKKTSRLALAQLRRKLIRPGVHGGCPETIVIVRYI